MSVRVNLLPQATRERDRATRQRSGLAGGFLALLLIFGLLYWFGTRQIGTARDELHAEEQRTAELRGEVAQLASFRDLEAQQERTDQLLVEAMAGEVSIAGILQDLAMVMPPDTQLENLTLTIGADAPPDGQPRLSVGSFTATGRTTNSHAPGVERFLLELDKVLTFHGLHLASSTLDAPDDDVATFSLTGNLGINAVTNRYQSGLPETLR